MHMYTQEESHGGYSYLYVHIRLHWHNNKCMLQFVYIFSRYIGAWILDLLTLPSKFLTKRLKELRSVFQSSFNQTPCLKFSTKGPLTLKDLQQLKPSQSK